MLKFFWTTLVFVVLLVFPHSGTQLSLKSHLSSTPEPELNPQILARKTSDNQGNNNPDDDPIVPPN